MGAGTSDMATDQDLTDMSLHERATHLLITRSALEELSLEDAAKVVGYMELRAIEAGTVFVREGETEGNDHMLLVLDGDLSVENSSLQEEDDNLVVRLLGPGSLIGELGLLDGGPRSASCIASSDMLVAVLSREHFLQLLGDEPRVGSLLLLAMSKRMADTLRETTRKLKLFAQMNKVLSEELAKVARADEDDWFND
jgi:CRP/FNR family transcriptional regulator, cyclic AMP receptor protein